MPCSSGCPNPGSHESWGACVKAKALQIEGVEAHQYNSGIRTQINDYVRAREAGLQPQSVYAKDVRAAWKATDATGVPYRADKD